ncbi:MAG: DUF3592 domain-containing protein [Kiritimatiellia bacterium]
MPRKSSPGGSGCLVLFSLPFTGVGLFMLVLMVRTLNQSAVMSEWPTVPATILEAELKIHRSSDGQSEQAVARYEYRWEGRTYEGNKVSLGMGADNVGSFQERKANTLIHAQRNGRTVSLHVNPENPAESILYPELRIEMLAFYALFVLVFGGAGLGMLTGAVIGRRKLKSQAAREQEAPEEPWRWKPEWAAGEISSRSKTGAWVLSSFALFWNLVSSPVLFAFREEFFEKGNKAMGFALLFPLVGAGLIVAAVYQWLRWFKYGNTVLILQRVPGVIGGTLQGAIRIPRLLEADQGVDLELCCVRRITTGSGKQRSTRESELWSDSRHLRHLRSTPRGETLLPVLFGIPFSCLPVDESDSRNQVLWRLRASAKTRGVDFHTEFEVPVFRTAESDPEFKPAEATGTGLPG